MLVDNRGLLSLSQRAWLKAAVPRRCLGLSRRAIYAGVANALRVRPPLGQGEPRVHEPEHPVAGVLRGRDQVRKPGIYTERAIDLWHAGVAAPVQASPCLGAKPASRRRSRFVVSRALGQNGRRRHSVNLSVSFSLCSRQVQRSRTVTNGDAGEALPRQALPRGACLPVKHGDLTEPCRHNAKRSRSER